MVTGLASVLRVNESEVTGFLGVGIPNIMKNPLHAPQSNGRLPTDGTRAVIEVLEKLNDLWLRKVLRALRPANTVIGEILGAKHVTPPNGK